MQKVCFGIIGSLLVAGVRPVWAQQPPPAALAQCQSIAVVEQEVGNYAKQLVAKMLTRAEQAEQALAAAKQENVRMEEELTRVRQAWDDLKAKTVQPVN